MTTSLKMQWKMIKTKSSIKRIGMKQSKRQSLNRELLKLIEKAVESYPNLRFNQLLIDMSIYESWTDPYYEESDVTLQRVMQNRMKK